MLPWQSNFLSNHPQTRMQPFSHILLLHVIRLGHVGNQSYSDKHTGVLNKHICENRIEIPPMRQRKLPNSDLMQKKVDTATTVDWRRQSNYS